MTSPPATVVGSSFDLLEVVDALPDGATGEVVLRDAGASIVGVIFVEARRICWVAARGFAGRLSDLLRERIRRPLDAGAMEDVFRHCQSRGQRLGEYLVSEGMLDASDLREALLEHSSECLVMLGEGRVAARFSEHAGKGYAPDFTFSTGELATRVGVLANGCVPRDALEELRACEPKWGALYGRHPSFARPLPLAQVGELSSARVLSGVARWAASILDLASALDDRPRLVTVADECKGGSVLWSEGGLLSVACFVEQSQFSRATSRRAGRRM